MKLRNAIIVSMAFLLGGPLWAQTHPAATRAASESAMKVAVINIQTAISSTEEGKQAAQELASKFAPRRNELQAISKQMQSIEGRLQNGQSTLSSAEKGRLMRQGQQLNRKYQRKQQELQEDYQAAQSDAIGNIGAKMMSVIDGYARQHGYGVVLDSSPQSNNAVLYAATAVDITSQIVRLYNEKHPVKSAAAAKPKPKQ
jgi:outer membrane protein